MKILGFLVKIFGFLVTIFLFVPNVAASLFFKGRVRPTTSGTGSRKLPMHTCAVSILSSIHRAFYRAQELDGPTGSLFRLLARVAVPADPFARQIKNRYLSILTLADDRILAVECVIEKCFPPSAIVFDRVDNLVRTMEVFPEKAELIVAKLPVLIRRVPMLTRASSYTFSLLGSRASKSDMEIAAREKEIPMDLRSAYTGLGNGRDKYSRSAFSLPDPLDIETRTTGNNSSTVSPKSTYKEALLEGKEGDHQGEDLSLEYAASDEEDGKKGKGKGKGKAKSVGYGAKDELMNNDPILDLFDSSWHMNKPVKQGKGAKGSLVRAASYTN